jgi:hypothetical protein
LFKEHHQVAENLPDLKAAAPFVFILIEFMPDSTDGKLRHQAAPSKIKAHH